MKEYFEKEKALPYLTRYVPSVEAVEKSEIDKAIEEIMDIDWNKIIWKYDDVEIGFKSEVEEILKRNIEGKQNE